MLTWVVVGCGYTGTALARELVRQGDAVIATRRDASRVPVLAGVHAAAVDLARPGMLRAIAPDGAIVACLAPPGADPAAEAAELACARRLVYVSSTGVYAPAAGAWVDESWPIAPATRSGRARVAAEAALPAGAAILRAAGIHGPGRGIADRLRAGTYRIVGDGLGHVSRIHVDDLVAAIIAAGRRADVAGPINIADDDPAPIGEVADALAAQLQLPPPPRVPIASVDPEIAGMLAADRRIANARMKQLLGVALRYPSWRTIPV